MEITHDKTRHMFEFTENGNSAVVEYKPFDGGINILHTFVPKPLQNKGYGAKLVKETLKNKNIAKKECLRQNNFPKNIEIYNSILWNIGKI